MTYTKNINALEIEHLKDVKVFRKMQAECCPKCKPIIERLHEYYLKRSKYGFKRWIKVLMGGADNEAKADTARKRKAIRTIP